MASTSLFHTHKHTQVINGRTDTNNRKGKNEPASSLIPSHGTPRPPRGHPPPSTNHFEHGRVYPNHSAPLLGTVLSAPRRKVVPSSNTSSYAADHIVLRVRYTCGDPDTFWTRAFPYAVAVLNTGHDNTASVASMDIHTTAYS